MVPRWAVQIDLNHNWWFSGFFGYCACQISSFGKLLIHWWTTLVVKSCRLESFGHDWTSSPISMKPWALGWNAKGSAYQRDFCDMFLFKKFPRIVANQQLKNQSHILICMNLPDKCGFPFLDIIFQISLETVILVLLGCHTAYNCLYLWTILIYHPCSCAKLPSSGRSGVSWKARCDRMA